MIVVSCVLVSPDVTLNNGNYWHYTTNIIAVCCCKYVHQMSSHNGLPLLSISRSKHVVICEFYLTHLAYVRIDTSVPRSGVAGPLAAQGGGQICRPFVFETGEHHFTPPEQRS